MWKLLDDVVECNAVVVIDTLEGRSQSLSNANAATCSLWSLAARVNSTDSVSLVETTFCAEDSEWVKH